MERNNAAKNQNEPPYIIKFLIPKLKNECKQTSGAYTSPIHLSRIPNVNAGIRIPFTFDIKNGLNGLLKLLQKPVITKKAGIKKWPPKPLQMIYSGKDFIMDR